MLYFDNDINILLNILSKRKIIKLINHLIKDKQIIINKIFGIIILLKKLKKLYYFKREILY
jgi:hypothetical protein